jgi:hypothetical protein
MRNIVVTYNKISLLKIIALFASLTLASATQAQANDPFMPNSISLAYGTGKPDSLEGGRIALQWQWQKIWFANTPINFRAYWDASCAHWKTHGDSDGKYKSIDIIAIAPVFRLQTKDPLFDIASPYIEGSVGPSVLSASHLGHRDLGANIAFQDLLGAGLVFGDKKQFDLSYHYLHYSNARLFPPNNGIDIKMLLMLKYTFGN